MRAVPLIALALMVAGAAACSGPTRMGGFREEDARAVEPVASEVIPDACAVRNGRLVVEVERAVINEYPNRDAQIDRSQQPLLVRSLAFAEPLLTRGESHGEEERDLQSWITPRKVRSGERVDGLEGLRVLDLPLRRTAGRWLILRLAENDRTFPPDWVTRTTQATGAVGGAAAIGIAAPPAALLAKGVEVLARLDRDDRILVWTIALEQLIRDTTPTDPPEAGSAGRPIPTARRYRLETARRLPGAGGAPSVPAAQLTVIAFREPESGCGT